MVVGCGFLFSSSRLLFFYKLGFIYGSVVIIRTIQREVVMVVVDMIRKGNAMSPDYSFVRESGDDLKFAPVIARLCPKHYQGPISHPSP